MAKRLEVGATGLDGVPYRVDIYDANYSGSTVEEVVDERQFLTIGGGERDDEGLNPICPLEITLSVIQTVDMTPLADAAQDDLRTEVWRTDISEKEAQGYLMPDSFYDAPMGLQPDVVELRGSEGLPVLRKKTFDTLSISSGTNVPVMTGIRQILNEVYPTNLDIWISAPWYPDTAGQLSISDVPLQHVDFDPDNYRRSRPNGDEWWTLYEVLADLLRSQHLQIRQAKRGSEPVWDIRNRTAIEADGTIETISVDPLGSTTYLGPLDLTVDVSDELFEDQDERDFSERRQTVVVTHDHVEVTNLLEEPSFESGLGGAWIDSSTDISTQVLDHANMSDSPEPTSGDTQAIVFQYNSDQSYSPAFQSGAQQNVPFIRPRRDTAGRLRWSDHFDTFTDSGDRWSYQCLFRVNMGSWYLKNKKETVRAGSLPGDVSLPVSSLAFPIPRGARLPIYKKDDQGNTVDLNGVHAPGEDIGAFLEVSERASSSDTVIEGTLTEEVEQGWEIVYTAWESSPSNEWFSPVFYVPKDEWGSWGTRVIHFPMQDGNGSKLPRQPVSVEMGGQLTNLGGGILGWIVDNVKLQMLKGGSLLNESVATAQVDTFGDTDEIEKRLGSGPDLSNIARTYGGTINGVEYNTFSWGVGPNNVPADQPLEELHAKERLRYFREQNERRHVILLPENKSPLINGHEVIQLDGKNYTIQSFERQPSLGRTEMTLLEHNDYGTA